MKYDKQFLNDITPSMTRIMPEALGGEICVISGTLACPCLPRINSKVVHCLMTHTLFFLIGVNGPLKAAHIGLSRRKVSTLTVKLLFNS